jgi:hypothetical protein
MQWRTIATFCLADSCKAPYAGFKLLSAGATLLQVAGNFSAASGQSSAMMIAIQEASK